MRLHQWIELHGKPLGSLSYMNGKLHQNLNINVCCFRGCFYVSFDQIKHNTAHSFLSF